MMIVVLCVALLAAGARVAIREYLDSTATAVFLMLPMPLLAGLLWLLDRPGPVRTWYSTTCLLSGFTLGLIVGALIEPVAYIRTSGTTGSLFGFGLIYLSMLPALGPEWRKYWPRQCPSCGRISVIPVANLGSPRGERGWCASCGASFGRKAGESWRSSEPTA
jgi:hypothetical protein